MAINKLFARDPYSEAALAGIRKLLKRGKTPEQCACIEYLVRPFNPYNRKGCLQKKGCLNGNVMTMREYIDHVQGRIEKLDLKQRAIDKIGLDESQINEIPPVVISAFDLDTNLNDIYIKGKESDIKSIYIQSEESDIKGIFNSVSNIFRVTWIFFSSTQIYTYTYTLDTISDNATELTRDFFYTDVTCIRTEHQVQERIIARRGKGCGCLKPTYYHANIEWDTLEIVVPSDSYKFSCRTNDTIDQSIQATKAMIREKKGL